MQSIKIASEVYKGIPIIADYAQPYSLLGELYAAKKEYKKSLPQYDLALSNIIIVLDKTKKVI